MSEKEYIERGALLKRFAELHDGGNWLLNDYNADWIHSFIETAPAADVVEVVRCKDCKHYGFTKIAGESYMTCKNHFGLTDPSSTDFCINGERKEQT